MERRLLNISLHWKPDVKNVIFVRTYDIYRGYPVAHRETVRYGKHGGVALDEEWFKVDRDGNLIEDGE